MLFIAFLSAPSLKKYFSKEKGKKESPMKGGHKRHRRAISPGGCRGGHGAQRNGHSGIMRSDVARPPPLRLFFSFF
jgi:hypothetical protein